MAEDYKPPLPTQSASPDVDDALVVNLDSWEGPLDLLLMLARQQKVDLRSISILRLVEQYLDYIESASELKLEVAADYLVMAAWLAYLKSTLLLPKAEQESPSPDELALRLQLRLQRLDAMREAAARLMAQDRLGRDIFLRGSTEGLKDIRVTRWEANLFDILRAYSHVRLRTDPVVHAVVRRPVMSLDQALANLRALIGTAVDWRILAEFLPTNLAPELKTSGMASTFLAALELAKQGKVDLRQEEAFAPLYLKALPL